MNLPFMSKKEAPVKAAGKGYAPTDRVQQLMSRGFAETDVIDVLRKDGFSPEEIDSALTQNLKENAMGSGTAASYTSEKPDFMGGQQQPSFPPQQQQQQQTQALPTIDEIRQKQQPVLPETSLPAEYYQSYPTEDYIDYIVNERMAEVNQQVSEFNIRHQELEKKMDEIRSQLGNMVQTRSGEQQQVITKMDSAGETLEDITTRMGSLERAFKETLPALIESVRALSDLVQRMKRGV